MPLSCDGSALLVSLVQITRPFAGLRLNSNWPQHAELRKQRKSSAQGWRAKGATKLDLPRIQAKSGSAGKKARRAGGVLSALLTRAARW
jgi:hypothetical protein